jgi:hypothetical protein
MQLVSKPLDNYMLVDKSVIRIENWLHVSWEYVQLIVKPFLLELHISWEKCNLFCNHLAIAHFEKSATRIKIR